MSNTRIKPTTIVISALGGQGGGVLTNWLVNMAEQNDYFAQSTSVPGVAQRTGATIYYLEMFPKSEVKDLTVPPVMALMPMAGDVDLVVAAELMEAGRAVQRQFVTPLKTTLIASTHRVFSIAEKMVLGDGTGDSDTVLKAAHQAAKTFVAFDMESLAAEMSCVISSIMFGAIAGSKKLPFSREKFEDAIRAEGKMVEANLRGFNAGYQAAETPYVPEQASDTDVPFGKIEGTANTPAAQALIDRINGLPDPAREFAYAGATKLLDYQDLDYAEAYIAELEAFAATDKAPFDLTHELARYLALWMAFDDTIKVADIKTRSERVKKYRQEVRAGKDQIVHMVEFMHPRLEEIVGTMPVGMARFVLKSPFLTRFFEKFTGPRLSDTTKVSSFLMLYFMASLRFMRRKTLRYAEEHAEIKSWLDRVRTTVATDYDLAVEIVRCQRLIKGYGETHERGLGNFKTIMAALDNGSVTPAKVSELRTAALEDEDGKAFKKALAA
ncbi:MAG: indolepyruvate oxidoreductase subunit B [Alphaproteobacteria bacterium]|nr:MAG: indolepyruvate oxidoreductase subunit B [Alphaproteobacteria bacterium]